MAMYINFTILILSLTIVWSALDIEITHEASAHVVSLTHPVTLLTRWLLSFDIPYVQATADFFTNVL